jgi:pilus assembly protein CpaB
MLVAILVAALGSTLVFLYVQGINDRAIEDQNPVKVLTATDVISAGESLDDAQAAGKLALTDIAKANVLPSALTNTDAIKGELALTTIYPGEQILPEKFGNAGAADSLVLPKGKLAISVELTDYARVAGFIQPGSHIAIYVCVVPRTEVKNDYQKQVLDQLGCDGVQILLSDVEVLATGATSLTTTTTTDESGTQTTEEIPKTILTVAVDEQDSKRVVLADANGDLTFGLMTDDSEVTKNAPPVWALSAFK